MIIITKVENNRVAKFLSIIEENAADKLEKLLVNYPAAFIYDGDYLPSLWVENGEVTDVAIEENKVFTPLSAWQVRKVLTQFGLRDTVEDAILQSSQDTKDAWQFANEFRRDDALLNGMAQMLGMSDTQLDQLFEVGITL